MNGFADIHTHILPEVDDGAADLRQAMEMVRMAYKDGTRTIMLTPHYRGKYKADPNWLRKVFDALAETVSREMPDMKLYLGNEIHYEIEAPEYLSEGRVLTMNGSRYCLLEFGMHSLRSQVTMGVSEMLRYGFIPILAHAERCLVFRKDKTLVDDVLKMGALLQLNADSVMGKHGFCIKRFCAKLLKERKVHFIATDAHDSGNRPPLLRKCWSRLSRKYGEEYAARVFCSNAQAIVGNKYLVLQGDLYGQSE